MLLLLLFFYKTLFLKLIWDQKREKKIFENTKAGIASSGKLNRTVIKRGIFVFPSRIIQLKNNEAGIRSGASKNGGNKIEEEELGVLGFYRGGKKMESSLERTLQDGKLYRHVNSLIVAHLRDNNLNQASRFLS